MDQFFAHALTTAGNVGHDGQGFVEADVTTVGGVDGVNVPPLRAVEFARFHQFRPGVHGQIRLAQVRQVRVERQAVQILDDAHTLGVGRGAPVSLEGLFETGFHHPGLEYLVVKRLDQERQILLVQDFTVEKTLLEFHLDVLQLEVVVFAEEVVHQRPHEFQALVLEIVAVGGVLETRAHRQEPEDHVAQVVRLFRVIGFADVGQKIIRQNFECVLRALAFGQRRNVFNGQGLGHHRPRIVDRRRKHVNHVLVLVEVQQAHLDDRLVRHDTEGAEEDEEGNGFADIGHIHHNVLVGVRRGRGDNLYRQITDRFGDVFRDGPDVRRIQIIGGGNQVAVIIERVFPFAYPQHVVGEFLLGDDGFF